MSLQENKQIAETICEQIGGIPRLIHFTGAYLFSVIERGISISFQALESNKPNKVEVVLSPMDTYTMTFKKGEDVTDVVENVYFDMLMDVFEEKTGMFLTFHSRKSA